MFEAAYRLATKAASGPAQQGLCYMSCLVAQTVHAKTRLLAQAPPFGLRCAASHVGRSSMLPVRSSELGGQSASPRCFCMFLEESPKEPGQLRRARKGIAMGIVADRNKQYHCLEYEPSQGGEIDLIACGHEQCNPGQDCGPDRREHYHLHAILSGKGVLYTQDGACCAPGKGQLFLLKDKEVVQYIADEKEPWNYCWVTFDGPGAGEVVRSLGFTEGVYCLDSQIDVQEFYQLVLRMHEKPKMGSIFDMRRRGILLEFLSLAMEALLPPEGRGQKPEYSMETYVRRAMEFIRYNYATIGVADVIDYIGFNRSYFSTVFRKQVGLSLQEYLLNYRMQQARELLLGTDLPVQEVASRVGYEISSTFSQRYRSCYGETPRETREKKARKRQEEKR